MNSTLEKWLFFLGVILFLWFLVPETNASAAETSSYDIRDTKTGNWYTGCTYSIDGNIHTITVPDVGTKTFDFAGCTEFMIFIPSSSWSVYILACDDSLRFDNSWDDDRQRYGFCWDASSTAFFYEIEINSGNFRITDDSSDLNSGTDPFGYITNCNNAESTEELITRFNTGQWILATEDIYHGGTLVFQRPLPSPTPTPSLQQQFQTAVMGTNLEAVMNQVVGLSPLLIGFLITLISFSKGLQLLSQILRRA